MSSWPNSLTAASTKAFAWEGLPISVWIAFAFFAVTADALGQGFCVFRSHNERVPSLKLLHGADPYWLLANLRVTRS
jgi:hypothetical protein